MNNHLHVISQKRKTINWKIGIFLILSLFIYRTAEADNCYQSSIVAPAPFLGNHEEIVQLRDGSLWQVLNEYEYLYEYYPSVDICPQSRKLIINGKALNVALVKSGSGAISASSRQVRVVFKPQNCRSYFLADGDSGGIYLLEWYGGHDPEEGDAILGKINSYGFKDVFYPNKNSKGRVYVDDFMLSRDRAIEKISEKCR